MAILIFAILVAITLALLCWAVAQIPLPSPFGPILQALIILVGVVIIAQRSGLL